MRMNKRAKKALVPELRFPEFREAGEWERKQLSELLFETKQRNRKLEYGPEDVLSVSGEYGCVNQIEFMGRSYAGVTVKDYHVVETGDIVYTKSPLKKNPFGIIKENKGKPGIVSTLYAVYRVTDMAYPAYLDHYFESDFNLNSYLQPIVNKGAKNDMKVKNSYVLSGKIPAPKIEEQQKIADCLTSIDELITAQTKKLDTIKGYKKGLMHQLFPVEDKTLPKRRFPEFLGNGEWKVKRVEEVCEKPFSGSTPTTTIQQYYGGTIPFIRSAEIDKEKTELFLTDEGLKNSSAKLVKKGDVLVALYGANSGDVALGKIDGAINQAVICLRSKGSNAFLYQYLSYKKQEIISKYLQGGQGNLSGDIIKSIELLFTESKEQQKIADCLSSVDELITAHTKKLDALKALKKGLIQQLFPAMDEVSA
jgi:type I restriction enzyme, S subunit